ncbi:MAG: cytochrome c biogenesis protein ResB, partial [Bacillota bacterium]|nr:cytochrome c biogenesis protein ResB [Bacillota bacterium]
LVLLLILAVATAIGTLIPQNAPWETYVSRYGEPLARVFSVLGLVNLYHSWWFIGLLVILSANSLICSFNRLPGLIRETQLPKGAVKEGAILNLKSHRTVDLPWPEEEAVRRIIGVLKKRFYRVATFAGERGPQVYGDRGRFGDFGSLVTHLSIVVILLGGLYGALAGFTDYVAVPEGETFAVPQGGFSVRVDDFTVEYYQGSEFRPKQFKSALTILERGEPVLSRTIYVNGPLTYKGIKFYQSSYGWAVDLKAQPARGGEAATATVFANGYYQVPGSPWTVRVFSFIPDYDPSAGNVGHPFSRSPYPNNPRVSYVIYHLNSPVRFDLAAIGEPIEVGDYTFTFTGYREYTGLQVRKDPGVPVVYLGFLLMIVGLFISFYLFPRKLWVQVTAQGGGSRAIMGGTVRRNPLGFEAELDSLVADLKRSS